MNLCAGVVGAWRNPRAHSTDIEDSPESALMMLETIDHLMAVVAEAKRTRSRKKAPKPGP